MPCFIDAQHAFAHDSVRVIGARTVITGTSNFTKPAEDSNAGNLLVIADADMAAKYAKDWQAHRQDSEPHTGLPRSAQPESRSSRR